MHPCVFAVAKCWYNHEEIQLIISGSRRRGHRRYGSKKKRIIGPRPNYIMKKLLPKKRSR